MAKLVDYAVTVGIDRAQLLAAVGLTESILANVDARVPLTVHQHVAELSAIWVDDPIFGIHYVEATGFSCADAFGFVAMTSRTLGESFERFIRHQPTLSEGENLEMEIGPEAVTITCHQKTEPCVGRAHITEMYAAAPMILIPRITGKPLEIAGAEFSHAQRAPLSVYQKVLGCTPLFEQPADAWHFSRSIWDIPMPRADGALVSFFEDFLSSRATQRTTSTAHEVRQAIAECFPDGEVSLQIVADRMGVGVRTLQRRLSEESMTFANVVDQVREAQAKAYLHANLPLREVSDLLGYAEVATFQRAFKRWTSMSPGAWRLTRSS